MKPTLLIPLLVLLAFLCSCSMMPTLLNDAEHVIDDTAVTIKVSQEAISKNTNLTATVELDNGLQK